MSGLSFAHAHYIHYLVATWQHSLLIRTYVKTMTSSSASSANMDEVTRLSTVVATAVVNALGNSQHRDSQQTSQASTSCPCISVGATGRSTDCNVVSINRSSINTQR